MDKLLFFHLHLWYPNSRENADDNHRLPLPIHPNIPDEKQGKNIGG